MWYDLKKNPPSLEEYAVLLFPCKTDCGLGYILSNPVYARGFYAKEAGYTHWARFELHPDHEKMLKELDDNQQ